MRDLELTPKSYPFGILAERRTTTTFLAAAIKTSQLSEIHRLHFA